MHVSFSFERLIIRFVLSLLFVGLLTLVTAQISHAQNPSSWQQDATGLLTSQNANKETGGLTMVVQNEGWPFLSLHGGVTYYGWGNSGGPTGIPLGEITIPGVASSSLTSESADWSHDELTYNGGTSSPLQVWVSRMSPAILINDAQPSATSLDLFTGNVSYFDPSGNNKSAPSSPKYVAYSTGGVTHVQALSTNMLSLPSLDNGWLLVWYGTNSHFDDTQLPIPYPFPQQIGCCNQESATIPDANVYQADAPILLVFQVNPTGIAQSAQGGIQLTFGNGSGYVSLLPLYGLQHLQASVTDGWGTTGLPADALQKIAFWTTHVCSFPTTVAESYAYAAASDTANITENFSYVPVCATGGGTPFALIPPMLGIAKDAMPITFSGPLVDASLPTEFGPTIGIENVSSYTWSVTGLNKYVSYSLPTGTPGTAPPDLMSALTSEVDKVIQAGHYAPWYIGGKMTANVNIGDLYFENPADEIYILTEIIPVLPEPEKTELLNYLESERTAYPPESMFNEPFNQGTPRGDFNVPDQNVNGTDIFTELQTARPTLFLQRVPLYNFYALAQYYALTGQPIPSSVMTDATSVLDQEMANQDWATMYWFQGFDTKKTAVENANRYFAGMIGLVRLSALSGDTSTEDLARSLLAKAAVLRIAMAEYPRYLYGAGLVTLPSNPAWEPTITAGQWVGYLYNYSWTGPYDDARQVTTLNQFQVILYDSAGYNTPYGGDMNNGSTYAYLTAFRDLVPETAQLLKDDAKADVDVYIDKYTALMPDWYVAFADTPFGEEHGFSYPIDSYEMFLAKDWIDGESPQNLATYADISWLSQGGDFFYIQKLAEAVRAYQVASSTASATPNPWVTPTVSANGTSTPTTTSYPTQGPRSTPTPQSSPTPIAAVAGRMLPRTYLPVAGVSNSGW